MIRKNDTRTFKVCSEKFQVITETGKGKSKKVVSWCRTSDFPPETPGRDNQYRQDDG